MLKLLLVLSLLAAPAPTSQVRSIVKVTSPGSICTGVTVSASQGHILSAAHCVPENNQGVLVDGKEVKVLRKSRTLVLLQGEAFQRPPITVRKGKLPPGEEVWSLGYAYDMALATLRRTVSHYIGEDLLMDGPIAGGMSGGPVVDSQGRLVGINQATERIYNASSIACGGDEIIEFLKSK